MKAYKYIDVSGLGNAGKSAVADFLSEFSSVQSFEYSFEFDLIRLPNGIIDLYNHLVLDWSPIRSNEAIRSFKKLTKSLGGSPHKKNLAAYLFSAGTAYERRFQGQFNKLSKEYIEQFIAAEYEAFWPYYLITDYPWIRLFKKLMIKFHITSQLKSPLVLANGKNFSEITTDYINKLYSIIVPETKDFVILQNSFEPFNPVHGLNILQDSKSILVIRDPRDVYVSGLNNSNVTKKDKHLLAFDNNGINKSFLGSDDLDIFITRQKIYFERLFKGMDPRVKIIRFEDFVLDSEKQTRDVINFLGLKDEDHKNKGQFFKPEVSAKNIGAWRKYSRQEEIQYIEKHLSEYCFQSS